MLGECVNPLRGAPVQLLKHPGLSISGDSAKQSEANICRVFSSAPIQFASESLAVAVPAVARTTDHAEFYSVSVMLSHATEMFQEPTQENIY